MPYSLDNKIMISLADAYCRTGQYADALPLLEKIRTKEPDNASGIELSAIAFEKTGDLPQASRMYKDYLSRLSGAHHPDYALHLGELYEKRSLTEEAIAQYSSNIKECPQDMRNYEHLGKIYVAARDWGKAKQTLESAASYSQQTPGILLMLAETYTALNNENGAVEFYTKYLAKVPDDSTANLQLGTICFNRKGYNEATGPLTKATELMPGNFGAFSMLGRALVETGNLGKAVAPLSHAHILNPSNTEILEYAAHCYRTLKETASLVTTLQKWTALDKKRFEIRIELGALLLADQRIDEAIGVLNEATTLVESEVKPHQLLAQAYAMKGDDSLRLFHLTAALGYRTARLGKQ